MVVFDRRVSKIRVVKRRMYYSVKLVKFIKVKDGIWKFFYYINKFIKEY